MGRQRPSVSRPPGQRHLHTNEAQRLNIDGANGSLIPLLLRRMARTISRPILRCVERSRQCQQQCRHIDGDPSRAKYHDTAGEFDLIDGQAATFSVVASERPL